MSQAILEALTSAYWSRFRYGERTIATMAAKAAGIEPDRLTLDELTAIVRHHLKQPDFVAMAEEIERVLKAEQKATNATA